MKTVGHKNKTKSYKANTVGCQCCSHRYRVSELSAKCGGCNPKGLIDTSLSFQWMVTFEAWLNFSTDIGTQSFE